MTQFNRRKFLIATGAAAIATRASVSSGAAVAWILGVMRNGAIFHIDHRARFSRVCEAHFASIDIGGEIKIGLI